jgi:L-ascorbate metabolism protein UlaG (beta-lactamase superfamily)
MQIQYLGHAAFKLTTGDAVVLFDPFLTGNPRFTGDRDAVIAGTTHVLLTHAHNDHFGDTFDIVEQTGAMLVASPEICDFVEATRPGARVHGLGIGGSRDFGAFSVSVVQAFHSSSYNTADGRMIYGGMPTGLILKAEGQAVYHMGDTGIFGDMALINELHRPTIGIVPIGDNYTMGPEQAALAVNRFFDFERVIPCHFATFGVLAPSAEPFARQVAKSRVDVLEPMASLTV